MGCGQHLDGRAVENLHLNGDRIRLGRYAGANLQQRPADRVPPPALVQRHPPGRGRAEQEPVLRGLRSYEQPQPRCGIETEIAAAHRHDRAQADVALAQLGAEGPVHPDRRADAGLFRPQPRPGPEEMAVRSQHPGLLGRGDDMPTIGGEEAEQVRAVALDLGPVGSSQPVQLLVGQGPGRERVGRPEERPVAGAGEVSGGPGQHRRQGARIRQSRLGVPRIVGRRGGRVVGPEHREEPGRPGGPRCQHHRLGLQRHRAVLALYPGPGQVGAQAGPRRALGPAATGQLNDVGGPSAGDPQAADQQPRGRTGHVLPDGNRRPVPGDLDRRVVQVLADVVLVAAHRTQGRQRHVLHVHQVELGRRRPMVRHAHVPEPGGLPLGQTQRDGDRQVVPPARSVGRADSARQWPGRRGLSKQRDRNETRRFASAQPEPARTVGQRIGREERHRHSGHVKPLHTAALGEENGHLVRTLELLGAAEDRGVRSDVDHLSTITTQPGGCRTDPNRVDPRSHDTKPNCRPGLYKPLLAGLSELQGRVITGESG